MRARVVSLLFAALLLFGAVFTFHYTSYGWRICHPPRTPVTDADRARAKLALPGVEEVSFQGADGVALRGWFLSPKSGAVVILVHGLGGNRASLLPDAEVMVRAGYGVLLCDSRASGDSGGTVATWGVREALDVAGRQVMDEEIAADEIERAIGKRKGARVSGDRTADSIQVGAGTIEKCDVQVKLRGQTLFDGCRYEA